MRKPRLSIPKLRRYITEQVNRLEDEQHALRKKYGVNAGGAKKQKGRDGHLTGMILIYREMMDALDPNPVGLYLSEKDMKQEGII